MKIEGLLYFEAKKSCRCFTGPICDVRVLIISQHLSFFSVLKVVYILRSAAGKYLKSYSNYVGIIKLALWEFCCNLAALKAVNRRCDTSCANSPSSKLAS